MKANQNLKKIILWPWLILVLAIGFILRYWNLTAVSLWHDEAFSVLMVKYQVGEMISRLILDVHPPLYYLAYYGWQSIFGNQVFDLRFFSLVLGMVTLIGLWLLVKKTFEDRMLAFWVVLVSAVNPFLVLYSQEGRMYALGLFLVVFANFFLIKAIREKEVVNWFFFIVLASCATYVHYYLLFSVFAALLFIGYKAYQQKEARSYYIKSLLISISFLVALYLPWMKHFFSQAGQVQDNYWIPEMVAGSVPNTLINLLTGGVFGLGDSQWWLRVIIVGLILFLFVRGLGYLKEKSVEGMALILINFLTPFVLAILLSFKQSLYLDRYFIFIVPFYLIILTAGIYSFKPRKLRVTLILIFAAIMTFSYIQHWNTSNIEEKPGMRGASTYLNNSYEENEKILATSSFVYFTFKYYNQTDAKPMLYSPGELSHFSGTALLSEDDIVKDFDDFVEPGDVVWLINTSGFGNFQPEFPADWHKISSEEFPDSNSVKGSIFIEKYRIFGEQPQEMIE
jgi:mannosyltransferase